MNPSPHINPRRMIRTRRSQNSPTSDRGGGGEGGAVGGGGVEAIQRFCPRGGYNYPDDGSPPREGGSGGGGGGGGNGDARSSSSSSFAVRTSLLLRTRQRRNLRRAQRFRLAALLSLLGGAGCLLYWGRSSQPSRGGPTLQQQSRQIRSNPSPPTVAQPAPPPQVAAINERADQHKTPLFQLDTPGAPDCTPPLTVDFTLVTQCSDDRLWMMQYHCNHWHGPISLAVYTNSTLVQVQSMMEDMHCHNVVVHALPANRPDEDYPVNELRNMAFHAVQTSHLVYVDIDFWVSSDLYRLLHQHTEALRNDPQLALVLPAFALKRQCRTLHDCPLKNIPHMPLTKIHIMENLLNRTITAFDPTNYGGHGSTHYAEWMDQSDVDLEPIDCVLSNRYEPYLVVRYCRNLPPFQSAFSGYGKNKMTWVMQLRRQGYRFSQLNSFVCHYPHLDSRSRMAWNGNNEIGPPRAKPANDGDLTKYKRGRNDALFVQFKQWLGASVPDHTIVGFCRDHLDDDAKLWVDRSRLGRGRKGAEDQTTTQLRQAL